MPVKVRYTFSLLLLVVGLACNAVQMNAPGATDAPVVTEQAAQVIQPTPDVEGQQTTTTPLPEAGPTPTLLPDELIAPLDVEEQLVTNVYERVSPSVVHVTSRVTTLDFFFGPVPSEGTGSGFIFDREGHIVTNYHVIEGADSIVVTLSDETKVSATVVGVDSPNDLALLKIDVSAEQVVPVELGRSEDLRVGQRAIAIGNPFGLDRTLTVGVISALGRPLQTSDDNFIYNVIQTDAAINPGNSGGPLLNTRGQVIGVNTAIRQGAEGIGFAVPVDTVTRVVAALIEKGYYPHPWLGFLGYDITAGLANALDLPVDRGILVARLYENGPALRGGLRGAQREVLFGNQRILAGGDIVVGIDDWQIHGWNDLSEYLELYTEVGDEVVLHIIRDGNEQALRLTVAEQP